MNINAFKGRLLNGGSRANQFLVTLNWPALVGSPGGDHNLLVSSASLPASTVNPTIVQYRGREVKFSGERIFEPWSITVLNDTDMTLRAYFEKWSNLFNNYENNGGVTAPAGYMADLIVQQLDRNDEIIRTYNMKDAFPINVGNVSLGYGLNDIVSDFEVVFAYQTFEVALP